MVLGIGVVEGILASLGASATKAGMNRLWRRQRPLGDDTTTGESVTVSSQDLANPERFDDVLERVAALEQNQRDERAANVLMVLERTVETLTDTDTPGETPDSRWVSAFVDGSQHASTDELRELWARVLAGETERPRSVSVRTLNVLNDLDRYTAQRFRRVCSMAIQAVNPQGIVVGPHIPYPETLFANALSEYQVSDYDLRLLVEYGLLSSELCFVGNYNSCISPLFASRVTPSPSAWLVYGDRRWDLVADPQRNSTEPLAIEGALLTRTGTELAQVVEKEALPHHEGWLREFFEGKGLAMNEQRDDA